MDLIKGNITTLDVDCIVNAANEDLMPGGGVCGAIHQAAGKKLALECNNHSTSTSNEFYQDGIRYSLPIRINKRRNACYY